MARRSFVVDVDNLEIATSVIRSLRSASGSQKRYQLQARSDDITVEGVDQLNNIIEKQRSVVQEQNSRQQKIVDAINNMGASTAQGSPFGSPNSKASPQPAAREANRDGSEHGTQRLLAASSRATESKSGGKDSDDDFLGGGDDDDDDDMRELMSGFVGPSSALTKYNSKRAAAVDDEVSVGAGSESLGSGARFPRKLNPLKQPAADVANAALKKGIVIKPGQAIRVSASGRNKKI